MDVVIKVIGIVIIAVGILYLLRPNVMKYFMAFFKKGKRIYLTGLIRLSLAIVFLLGARECDITWVIVAFGILFMVSGLLIFMLGPKKIKPILEWFEKQPLLILRLAAIIALAMGGIIIYAA